MTCRYCRKFINWACYKIVMIWPWQMPSAKWFMWMLARAGLYAAGPELDGKPK